MRLGSMVVGLMDVLMGVGWWAVGISRSGALLLWSQWRCRYTMLSDKEQQQCPLISR